MQINLIPEKLRPKIANPLPYIIVGTLCAVALVAMVYGVFWAEEVEDRCSKHSRELNELKKQLRGKDEVVERVQQLQAEIEEAEGQLGSLSDVIVGRIVWSRIMLELAEAAPPNLALKEISHSGTDATCKVLGTSSSPGAGPDVARLASNLRTSKYLGKVFRSVKIDSCSSTLAEGGGTAFALTMSLKKEFEPIAMVTNSEEGPDGTAE